MLQGDRPLGGACTSMQSDVCTKRERCLHASLWPLDLIIHIPAGRLPVHLSTEYIPGGSPWKEGTCLLAMRCTSADDVESVAYVYRMFDGHSLHHQQQHYACTQILVCLLREHLLPPECTRCKHTPVTCTTFCLMRPTQSAKSMTLGSVALSSTKPTLGGSIMMTCAAHAPQRQAPPQTQAWLSAQNLL